MKDGKADHLTREPEQVKAFRDTWRDGIHSYLTYLRDRLTVARDLLTDSGSIFVQIGDENVHRVRALMDEVFGEENFCSLITVLKTTGAGSPSGNTDVIPSVSDYILWYARNGGSVKYRRPYFDRRPSDDGNYRMGREDSVFDRSLTRDEMAVVDNLPSSIRVFSPNPLTSQTGAPTTTFPVDLNGSVYRPGKGGWKTNMLGMGRLSKANRLMGIGSTLRFIRFFEDFASQVHNNLWTDTRQSGFGTEKIYVVQTVPRIIERCILMTTDPGDLVLDPTCGSGTTAYVAEQWGRRWITIDTSRVALALARARIMGARYPWYLLADSREGQIKEAEVTRTVPRDAPTFGRIRQGFVYKRVPHITLKSIANNAEIDTIWESYQAKLEPLRETINAALATEWQEWEMPRELPSPLPSREGSGVGAAAAGGRSDADVAAEPGGSAPTPSPSLAGRGAEELLAEWWQLRIARQREIDASIAAKADTEYLYDQPYTDNSRVRVAGPFTVESLSPHRVPAVDADDSLFDEMEAAEGRRQKLAESGAETGDFTETILASLAKAGVQQAHREDRIKFESLHGWPGSFICAEGRYVRSDGVPQRAGILVGPEYGTVAREDLMAAARECGDAGFDLLIACAFNYDAHASEVEKLGRLAILKARINPDLHMPELADTGAGNLFTVFGEPDIQVHDEGDGMISIEVAGIDMYKGGQIESSSAGEIAVWFVDTDYNYESFFVRHAYFPGANDPYKALKTTLKAEIDEDAWASLKRTRSRPFPRPASGQVAIKVINHLGDEVMKVVGV